MKKYYLNKKFKNWLVWNHILKFLFSHWWNYFQRLGDEAILEEVCRSWGFKSLSNSQEALSVLPACRSRCKFLDTSPMPCPLPSWWPWTLALWNHELNISLSRLHHDVFHNNRKEANTFVIENVLLDILNVLLNINYAILFTLWKISNCSLIIFGLYTVER